jgi:hypothetical protein
MIKKFFLHILGYRTSIQKCPVTGIEQTVTFNKLTKKTKDAHRGMSFN